MSSTAHQTTPGTAVAAPLTPFGKLAELPANQMPPTQLSLNPKIERITSVIQKGAFFSGSIVTARAFWHRFALKLAQP